MQVLDRPQLHVEQVTNLAVRVGGVSDPVELEVRISQPCLGRRLGELEALGELDPVRGRLDAVVPDFASVPDRVEEVRRQGRFAARELHRHLAFRFDRDRVVEHRLDVVPAQLVDEPDLVRIHEARVAHHVTAVRQVDRQDRATTVLDGAAAMVMQLLVVVRDDVASGKRLLEMTEERRVHGHHVFEATMNRAVFDHHDLAVAFDDLRLDLADLLVEQNRVVFLTVQDFLAGFPNARRAERIGLARPAEGRLDLLVRLQQRLLGPTRDEGLVLPDLVQRVEHDPPGAGHVGRSLLGVLNRLVHGHFLRSFALTPRTSKFLIGRRIPFPETTS